MERIKFKQTPIVQIDIPKGIYKYNREVQKVSEEDIWVMISLPKLKQVGQELPREYMRASLTGPGLEAQEVVQEPQRA